MKIRTQHHLPNELSKIRTWRKTLCHHATTGCHVDLALETEDLISGVQILFDAGYFLEDIAGVDLLEGIMLVYHFDRYDMSARVILRMIAPHETRTAPSITGIFSGADWHERECFDFFGVVFENHPNLKPLLLPDDLGMHPLIKTSGRKPFYSLIPLGQTVDG